MPDSPQAAGLSRPRRVHKNVIVRRGDTWHLDTNYGTLIRHVRSVAMGVVSYLNNGRLYRCQLNAFREWCYGAELVAAEDWSGRK